MSIIAVRLVLVQTKTGSVVMCKIPMVVVMFFECTQLSLATTNYHSSWSL